MGKLLPVILGVVGLAGGAGAGFVMRPAPAPEPEVAALPECVPSDQTDAAEVAKASAPKRPAVPDPTSEFVKIANQFVVPLMGTQRVEAMLILSLSLEVAPGSKERVYNFEPRLRDAFLTVLFDHANAGAFEGNFLNSSGLQDLRTALREVAVTTAGPELRDVLIVDLVKQEM